MLVQLYLSLYEGTCDYAPKCRGDSHSFSSCNNLFVIPTTQDVLLNSELTPFGESRQPASPSSLVHLVFSAGLQKHKLL